MVPAIDPTDTDSLIDLKAYGEKLSISKQTLWRWCRRGVGGHKLPCVLIANRLFTSKAALAEFSRLTQPASPEPAPELTADEEQRLRERGLLTA